ncbi:hypothetical protein F8568_027640 [Actinomadura sp. LD22]|uniref:Uncharacterized protein n=1 Tax=Actinomadura physcomitrii TaxID=2650748 RepID=A0A6I4MCY7_9ACTN|nr:hypothetical protein [Actinomadura physcomitrii]MWA04088.1 hypothetical protein [Actinomadura physcomitrii]
MDEDHISFLGYEFRGASVHPRGKVTPARIRDADWTAIVPEIRTVLGETLFVPRERKSDLEAFCRRHGIERVARPDVWEDLLEPFLDTRIAPDQESATLDRLRDAGFAAHEVSAIRRRLTPLMLAYNFDAMVWAWAYLGLFDLLHAANAPVVDPGLQADLGEPAAFYAWAMAIADRHR